LTRTVSGDLTEIVSPQGRWIRFEYSQSQMIRARDSLGNVVDYEYDGRSRLTTAKYPDGHCTKYSYDTANRIIAVEDASEDVVMEIKYDASGGCRDNHGSRAHLPFQTCIRRSSQDGHRICAGAKR
jgi:YD repeat-containing protein